MEKKNAKIAIKLMEILQSWKTTWTVLDIGTTLKPNPYPLSNHNMGMGWYTKAAISPKKSNTGYLSQEKAAGNLLETESLIQALFTYLHALNTH